MKCEFEEKTYEQYHNIELLSESKIFYPPGQVQENILGFDSALFSKNLKFWKLWREIPLWRELLWQFWPFIPPGLYLNDLFWDRFEETLDYRTKERFKFNVFIQYKRPEYIKSAKAKEYSYWNKPYFRYNITIHQHRALINIEKLASELAIVTYAAPAFCSNEELNNYFSSGKLIENSNYVKPSTLINHQRWTYINSGIEGLAFSEPERKTSIKLLDQLKKYSKETRIMESNSQFIKKTSYILVEAIRKTENYHKVFDKLIEQILLPEHPLGKALFSIYIILHLTNLKWAIYYEDYEDELYFHVI